MARHNFGHQAPYIPDMFRGNCPCGKWMMIPLNRDKQNAVICEECGRTIYWQKMTSNVLAIHEHHGTVHVLVCKEDPDARKTEGGGN